MRFLEVIGIEQVGGMLFYANMDGIEMPITADDYDTLDASMRDGDVWIYDAQEEQLIKYGTQLDLFNKRVEGVDLIKCLTNDKGER